MTLVPEVSDGLEFETNLIQGLFFEKLEFLNFHFRQNFWQQD